MALLLAGSGVFLLGPGRRRTRRHGGRAAERSRWLPLLAGVLVALLGPLLAGRTGLLLAGPLGVGAGFGVRQLLRSARAGPDTRAVAFVLDLLASALAAGAPADTGIAAVSAAIADHGSAVLADAVQPLRRVGRLLQLGTEPAQAWSSLAPVAGYGPVAAAGRRCAYSGARLAGALGVIATELRAAHRETAVGRAERTGVWTLLPLGCCFLPAFVCIGIVPVVLGLSRGLLIT